MNQSIETLKRQYEISQQALIILEQKAKIDLRENEKQLNISREQLEILRLAELQLNQNIARSQESAIQEKKSRLNTEEKLFSYLSRA